MNFHPTAEIFPMMSEGEIQDLAQDIRQNGLREPIWTYQNSIIDGRNRYKACQIASVEPRYREWDGQGSLIAFVVSLNLKRRHLTESQRAMVAAKLANLQQGRPETNRSIDLFTEPPISQPAAAELLNVSVPSVKRAAVIHRDGVDALKMAVSDGKVSVSAAAEVARLPQEIQQEIVAKGKDEIIRTAKELKTHQDQEGLDTERNARREVEAEKYYITLDEWDSGVRTINAKSETSTFNKTNDNIEWAAWSWNPVTGCLHQCDYCYARDIAARFYPYGFQPAFIPGRLAAPKNTKPGSPRWTGDIGYRNVFTCSMADLFGKWVPAEWIERVIESARNNPQWTFLFLTKFPVRMAEFDYPPNVWLGTTVDKQHAVERAESAFRKIKASGFSGVCWLSCEPMWERLTFSSLEMFDWVIMGGASESTKTSEMRPPFDDIVSLYQQARSAGCKIYMKTNLGIEQRVREYPEVALSFFQHQWAC